jgi:predicted lipid-binding transport protein (Tim44 family)
MAHLDIIIYALIAVVLLVRLWAVFGRRNDSDRQRPNPFITPAPGVRDDEDVMVLAERGRKPGAPPLAPLAAAPQSLQGTLDAIKQLDPSFDEKQFLQNMRTLFTKIVDAFAKGDLADVKAYLGPVVLSRFAAAIAARKAAGETLSCRIVRIRDAETAAARLEDSRVFITMRIVSEQENILRDTAGEIVSGAAGKVEEITDLWTFARDMKSPNPAWQLVETKS